MLFISLRRPLTQRWTSSHRLVQFMLKHPHLWAELCRPKYWKYSTASHRKHWLLVFGVFQVVGTSCLLQHVRFPRETIKRLLPLGLSMAPPSNTTGPPVLRTTLTLSYCMCPLKQLHRSRTLFCFIH